MGHFSQFRQKVSGSEHAKWTLRLLAEELIALEVVETISPPTIMRAQKKRTQATFAHVLGDPARAKRLA